MKKMTVKDTMEYGNWLAVGDVVKATNGKLYLVTDTGYNYDDPWYSWVKFCQIPADYKGKTINPDGLPELTGSIHENDEMEVALVDHLVPKLTFS